MQLEYLLKKLFKNKILILFSLFFFFSSISFSQEPASELQSLIKILRKLERKHQIRFSYIKNDLRNKQIAPPDETLDLELALTLISQSSGVHFTQIDDRYIAVQTEGVNIVSICGTLIDKINGVPLKNATIVLIDSQISTDAGGNFKMNNIRDDLFLSIYYSGFQVQKMSVKELLNLDDCPLIFIDLPINFLPTIVLNGYLTPSLSKNADGSVTASNSNFEILPSLIEPDVLQIAQILPGIESLDETASNINIRGGKSDEVSLLYDEIKMYQSGHFFGLISAFNPNLIDNVTIYKNGTHPKFGESVSGVLSMYTKSEVPSKIEGGIGVNFISTSGYAQIPVSENLAFNISGRTSINSESGNPVYDQFFDRIFQNTVVTNINNNSSLGLRSTDEAFNFYDISLKGIWDASPKDKIQYNFLAINNNLDFTERFLSNNAALATSSELNQKNTINGFSWNRTWSKNLSSKILIHGTNYSLSESNRDIDTNELNSERNNVKEKELRVEVSYSLNKNIRLIGGYQYSDLEITNELINSEINISKNNRSILFSNGYYLDSKWNFFNKKTLFTTGIRVTEYPNLDETFIEPRINFYQELNDHFSLIGSFELKNQPVFQYINVQNSLLGIENKQWAISDEEESPILKSRQVSFGSIFTNSDWTLNLEAFYKHVEGVSSKNQGFKNQLQNIVSIGNYEVMGAEFSIGKGFGHLSTWLTYTYMENNYNFKDFTPMEFPHNFDVRHSMRVAAAYRLNSFVFSLGTVFRSGIPYTSPVNNNEIVIENDSPIINFSLPNNRNLNSYLRTDLSAVYTFRMDDTFKGKINVAFLNILNRKNSLEIYYKLEIDENNNTSINKIEQFSLGLTPNVSFQVLF